MYVPRHLATLWASTACYRDSFTFTFLFAFIILKQTIHIHILDIQQRGCGALFRSCLQIKGKARFKVITRTPYFCPDTAATTDRNNRYTLRNESIHRKWRNRTWHYHQASHSVQRVINLLEICYFCSTKTKILSKCLWISDVSLLGTKRNELTKGQLLQMIMWRATPLKTHTSNY
jgi:hypothetical protein